MPYPACEWRGWFSDPYRLVLNLAGRHGFKTAHAEPALRGPIGERRRCGYPPGPVLDAPVPLGYHDF